MDLAECKKPGRLPLFKKLNLLKSLVGVAVVVVVRLVLMFFVIEVFCGTVVTPLFDRRLETPPPPFEDFI